MNGRLCKPDEGKTVIEEINYERSMLIVGTKNTEIGENYDKKLFEISVNYNLRRRSCLCR